MAVCSYIIFMLQNFANTPKTGQKKSEESTVTTVLLQSLIFYETFFDAERHYKVLRFDRYSDIL